MPARPLSAAVPPPTRHVALGTLSFALCFAAWGLVSAFAPRFRADRHLSASQTALLVARPVFTILMVLSACPGSCPSPPR